MKFFGDARAANGFAPFKHERLQSRLGEIISGDQAVMAGADDDYLFLQSHKEAATDKHGLHRSEHSSSQLLSVLICVHLWLILIFRLSRVISGDQAVMTGADDDDVALVHRRKLAAD